jgi:hypothetical protein
MKQRSAESTTTLHEQRSAEESTTALHEQRSAEDKTLIKTLTWIN